MQGAADADVVARMKSLCRACGLTFTQVEAFDRHRTGKYDIAAPGYGRRCRTPEEMLAKDWRETPRGWTHRPPRVAGPYARGEAIGSTPYVGKG